MRLRVLFRDKSTRSLFVYILIAIVILGVAYFIRYRVAESEARFRDRYVSMSSFNDGSSGTMALREFLDSLELDTKPVMESMAAERTPTPDIFKPQSVFDKDGVILVIEPRLIIEPEDVAVFERKAGEGYTLIFLSDSDDKIIRFLFPEAESIDMFSLNREWTVSINNPSNKISFDRYKIFDGVDNIYFPGNIRLRKVPEGWSGVARDKDGFLIIERKIDNGKLVVVSDSQFLSNIYIRRADNGFLAYRLISHYLADADTVYFDEYNHGYRRHLTMLYFLARPEYRNIILHALILVILFFIAIGVRFGQLKYVPDIEDGRIYYYSEGMSGLIAKRQFEKEIFNKITDNYTKLARIYPGKIRRRVMREIEDLSESKRHSLRALFDVIRQIKS
jgi:hypothetical protein